MVKDVLILSVYFKPEVDVNLDHYWYNLETVILNGYVSMQMIQLYH